MALQAAPLKCGPVAMSALSTCWHGYHSLPKTGKQAGLLVLYMLRTSAALRKNAQTNRRSFLQLDCKYLRPVASYSLGKDGFQPLLWHLIIRKAQKAIKTHTGVITWSPLSHKCNTSGLGKNHVGASWLTPAALPNCQRTQPLVLILSKETWLLWGREGTCNLSAHLLARLSYKVPKHSYLGYHPRHTFNLNLLG